MSSGIQQDEISTPKDKSWIPHFFSKGCFRNIPESLEKLGVGICIYPGLTGPFGLAPSGHGGGILRKVRLQCTYGPME